MCCMYTIAAICVVKTSFPSGDIQDPMAAWSSLFRWILPYFPKLQLMYKCIALE